MGLMKFKMFHDKTLPPPQCTKHSITVTFNNLFDDISEKNATFSQILLLIYTKPFLVFIPRRNRIFDFTQIFNP